ncbi:unnamed protein product [Cunninghamella echinulata]
MQKEWQFIENQKWLTTTYLSSHTKHRYPFQMILPGNISETMIAPPYGTLHYELKATAVKSTSSLSSSTMITQLPIHIHRLPLIQPDRLLFNNDNDRELQIVHLTNTWEQKVNYHIQLNKKIYQRGEPIQIQFTFRPLTQGLKIRHLSCFLKEYTTLHLNPHDQSSNITTTTQSKIISLVRNDQFPCRGTEWKKNETLIIPRSPKDSQFDLIHPFLEIEHKVKFTIHFIQQYGQLSQLHLTIPIKLCEQQQQQQQCQSLMQQNQRSFSLDDLPKYEDACLLMPYDPQQWMAALDTMPSLSPPYSPSPLHHPHHSDMDWDHEITTPDDDHPHLNTISSSSTNNNNNNNNNNNCDYFSYQPSSSSTHNNNIYSDSMISLHSIPSYETAIRSPF